MTMTQEWIDIRYRDFWDVPRIFVLIIEGRLLLADCPFSDQLDDFPDFYSLYELDPAVTVSDEGSWENLHEQAISDLGTIPVSEVIFDETKRKRVSADVFILRL